MTIKSVYYQAGRQTQGLLESLVALMEIDLAVPDHTTASRRMGKLEITLPVVPNSCAALNRMIQVAKPDSVRVEN